MPKVDLDEAVKQFNAIINEREHQTGEPVHFTAQDFFQIMDRVMNPEKKYDGIITKDLKTSNLDVKNVQKVVALKSIAKDFNVFRDSFDLEDDIWIKATLDSIDADAEIICAASQGFTAKLLDSIGTIRRESTITSRLDKEKKGEIFK